MRSDPESHVTLALKSSPDFLAVYGSLMRAEGMQTTLGVAGYLQFVAEIRVPGELFDLGEFPGLRLVGAGSPLAVPAELFAILNPRALDLLDEYEGCQEDAQGSSVFVRRRLRLLEPPVEVWVYLWQGGVKNCPRVRGMSWPEHKARRSSIPPASPPAMLQDDAL